MPDYRQVDRKVREARYFLGEMNRIAVAARNGNLQQVEVVGFHLSAFLSAARSIDYRLRNVAQDVYRDWRRAWDANLSAADAALITAMIDDRNVEVHETGTRADTRDTERRFEPGEYRVEGLGTLQVTGPGGMGPMATIIGAEYWIAIDGAERRAAEACQEYLGLLEEMVRDFEAAHP